MLRDVLVLWLLLLLNVILLENYDVQSDVNWKTVNFGFHLICRTAARNQISMERRWKKAQIIPFYVFKMISCGFSSEAICTRRNYSISLMIQFEHCLFA